MAKSINRCLESVFDDLTAFLQTSALPANLFLQVAQLRRVVIVKGECASPETAVDVRSLITQVDLFQRGEVDRGYAGTLAGDFANFVNLALARHVVEDF